ncbi:hypothetical protein BOX15_Mlig028724g1, partial [Macrostomum lignano]
RYPPSHSRIGNKRRGLRGEPFPRWLQCRWLILCRISHSRLENKMEDVRNDQGGNFSCTSCSKALTGQRYILREEKPHCIQCYEQVFANSCEQCKEKIGCDSKDLSYKDRHWHERCFKCSSCQGSLVDKPFATKDDALFCSNCHDEKYAARCDGCGKRLTPGFASTNTTASSGTRTASCARSAENQLAAVRSSRATKRSAACPATSRSTRRSAANASRLLNAAESRTKASPTTRSAWCAATATGSWLE